MTEVDSAPHGRLSDVYGRLCDAADEAEDFRDRQGEVAEAAAVEYDRLRAYAVERVRAGVTPEEEGELERQVFAARDRYEIAWHWYLVAEEQLNKMVGMAEEFARDVCGDDPGLLEIRTKLQRDRQRLRAARRRGAYPRATACGPVGLPRVRRGARRRGAGRPGFRRSSAPTRAGPDEEDGEPSGPPGGAGGRVARGLAVCPLCGDEELVRPRCWFCGGLGFVGIARRNSYKRGDER